MSDVFKHAVDSVSKPIATKQDLIGWAKSEYGEKGWSRKLAERIQPHMFNKKGEQMSIANIQRNWQGKRLHATGDTKTWREIGKTFPRTMTKKEFTLTIQAKQHDSRGGGKTRDRTIKVEFAGQAAKDFVNNPTWPKVWHQYGFSFPVAESDAADWGEDDLDFDYNEYDVDIDYELSDASVSAA